MTEEDKKERAASFEKKLRGFHIFSKNKIDRLCELHDWMEEKAVIEVSLTRFNFIQYLQAWCALIDEFIHEAINEVRVGKANPEEVKYLSLRLIKDQKILEEELIELGATRNDNKISLIPKLEILLSKKTYSKKEYVNNSDELVKTIYSYINLKEPKHSEIPANPYPEVFKDYFSFKLFHRLHLAYDGVVTFTRT